jgi:F0F1-type ATP synthase assembly protein I
MTRTYWTQSLLITVGLQWGLVAFCSALAWLMNFDSARSLFLGGAAVALPNAVLAGYLWLKARQVRALSAATFLGGEMLKLGGTLVAFYAVMHWMGVKMVWPALIIGVIVALKAQWLAVWFTRNS